MRLTCLFRRHLLGFATFGSFGFAEAGCRVCSIAPSIIFKSKGSLIAPPIPNRQALTKLDLVGSQIFGFGLTDARQPCILWTNIGELLESVMRKISFFKVNDV